MQVNCFIICLLCVFLRCMGVDLCGGALQVIWDGALYTAIKHMTCRPTADCGVAHGRYYPDACGAHMEDFNCTCTDDCVHTLPTVFFDDSTSTERSRRISPSYIATAVVISCTVHGFIAVGWSVDTLMYMTMYATSVKTTERTLSTHLGDVALLHEEVPNFLILFGLFLLCSIQKSMYTTPKSTIRPYSPVGV